MDTAVQKLVSVANNGLERLRHAISLEMTQAQLIRMLVMVILYISVVRPWMVKLADKEGVKQLAAMEQRDKEKKEKEQHVNAVNSFRGHKAAANEDPEAATSTATSLEVTAKDTSQRVQGKMRVNEADLLTAEEVRSRNLENWDEDQEFLRNFSKTSDRSH